MMGWVMSELFGEVIVINWNFLQIVVISQVENNCIENIINSKVNLKNHGHCRSYLSFKDPTLDFGFRTMECPKLNAWFRSIKYWLRIFQTMSFVVIDCLVGWGIRVFSTIYCENSKKLEKRRNIFRVFESFPRNSGPKSKISPPLIFWLEIIIFVFINTKWWLKSHKIHAFSFGHSMVPNPETKVGSLIRT